MGPKNSKAELRSHFRLARKSLTAKDHKVFSDIISKRVFEILNKDTSLNEAFQRRAPIALYSPIDQEVDLSQLFIFLTERGIPIALPNMSGASALSTGAHFFLAQGLDDIQMRGKIPVPRGNRAVQPNVIIVPGIAFSNDGYRLGFGKGFYDQVLARTKAIKIGVCFQCQRIEVLPVEPHDVRMDLVVTEIETLRLSPVL